MKYITILLITVSVAFFSCKDDTSTPGDNNNNQTGSVCDTLDVSYNSVVKAVIDNNCATAYCHGGAGAGNVYLASYSEVKTVAEQDRFLKAVRHEAGAEPMPKNGNKLSDGEITILECWIENGFKEN